MLQKISTRAYYRVDTYERSGWTQYDCYERIEHAIVARDKCVRYQPDKLVRIVAVVTSLIEQEVKNE